MVRVEVTAEFYDAGENVYHRTGDEIEVSEDFADEHPHLVEPAEDGDADEGGDESSEEDEAPDEAADFDEDAWLDVDYQQREAAVRDGEVDDHLERVEEIETSDNVQEAVDERRAELEE